MARNPDAYVDTSALIAFADRSDSYHPLFARLFANPPKLVTTALVVAEGQGWFLRRYDQTRALMFLALVEDLQPLSIVEAGAADVQTATALLRRFNDQRLTLTDAVGLHLMQTRRIQTCWSTDRHLGLTGVPLVIG